MPHVDSAQSAMVAHAHTKALLHVVGATPQAHAWWFAGPTELAELAELAKLASRTGRTE